MDKIINDFELDVATAHSRMSRRWQNRSWRWSELLARCEQTRRTPETMGEYLRMGREEQSAVKDVGGFVGGYLSGGVRKTANVMYRTLVTLDIDYGTGDVWDNFTLNFDCAAMLYSTHKHTPERPRLRLVIPAGRQITPAEYEPVCRYWTSRIGIDLFDHTTYQLPRLFYWPSTSRDGEYVFEYQDGPAFDVDAVLATYRNPQDVSEWPMGSREGDAVAHEIRKAGDPREKPGVIGAFCRTYGICEAIEKFLGDVYEPTATPGRYTYRRGTVAAGCVTYDDLWAYSHHETDPAGGRLCNAFDLVRIHLYGIRDEGSRVQDVTRLPSYLAMQDMAASDRGVRELLGRERADDFKDLKDPKDLKDLKDSKETLEWMAELDRDRRGTVRSTVSNIIRVLEHDPALAGHLWHDMFSGFVLVRDGLPWDRNARQWGDRDDANLRVYLDERYDITGKDKIKDAKDAVLTRHRIHPIKEYLEGLKWDGVERLDRLIIDYMGAADTELNRAMTRKHFAAAVARVMHPGCKYDYCLSVQGPEGMGKSTLFNIMGGEWFNDSLITTEGRSGMEQLRGAWIIELAELSSIKRSDVEQVKNYITRREDIYRAAYGTVVERHPRQCVFCGTTNESYFLKGDTGNRRFWVISLDTSLRRYDDYESALRADRDQLWAEAVQRWREGERLYLPRELEEQARERQAEYNDDADDPLRPMLEAYVETLLPSDWDSWDLTRRRAFLRNPDPLEAVGTERRTRVCAAEFVCERMGREMTDKEYKYLARRVCNVLGMMGWRRRGVSRHAERLYGRQKYYERPEDTTDENEDEAL